jgi:hypothetical protein
LPEADAELLAEVARLQQDNHKLARINAALIERIESGMTQGNDPTPPSSIRWCWPSRCANAPTR